MLVFDYDNDGDRDVFIANNGEHPVLYRNDGGNQNNWLRIDTEGTVSNRDGIGALITIVPDLSNPDEFLVREVDGGNNFLDQNEKIAHFGLGDHTSIDRTTIIWPSGNVQIIDGLQVNQIVTIPELFDDFNHDLKVDGDDFLVWQSGFGVESGATLSDGDADGDGDVDGDDFLLWQSNFGSSSGLAQGAAIVPEPNSAGLGGLCISAILRVSVRRRRNHR